jgi:hypothetical protein
MDAYHAPSVFAQDRISRAGPFMAHCASEAIVMIHAFIDIGKARPTERSCRTL